MLEHLRAIVEQHLLIGGGALGTGAALWAAARYGPGLLAGRLKAMFLKARSSGWLTDTSKPKRIKAYLAILEMIEEETPDKGDANADKVFGEWGAWVSSHLPPVISGTPDSWARLLRSFSDEIDDDLDSEIETIRNLKAPPGPSAS